MKILIGALLAATALQAQTPDVTGDWQGTLKVGAAELRLVLHITKTAAGLTLPNRRLLELIEAAAAEDIQNRPL